MPTAPVTNTAPLLQPIPQPVPPTLERQFAQNKGGMIYEIEDCGVWYCGQVVGVLAITQNLDYVMFRESVTMGGPSWGSIKGAMSGTSFLFDPCCTPTVGFSINPGDKIIGKNLHQIRNFGASTPIIAMSGPSFSAAIGSPPAAPSSAPSVFPSIMEEDFAKTYGGTQQEFTDPTGVTLKRNVAGWVRGSSKPGGISDGVLFDFGPTDHHSQPFAVSTTKLMINKVDGGDDNTQWSKPTSLHLFLVPLQNVIQPPGSPIMTVSATINGSAPAPIAVIRKPLDFIPITFELSPPKADRARYPKDCPACKEPAYESIISGWDCSNASCRNCRTRP